MSGGTSSANGRATADAAPEEDAGSLRGVVKELKVSQAGGSAEKNADSVCTLRPGIGTVRSA